MTSVRNIEKVLRDLPDEEISELLETLREEAGVKYSRFPRDKAEKVAAILYLLQKYPRLNTILATHDLAPAFDEIESFDWGEAIGRIGRAIFGGSEEEQKQPVQVIVEQPQQNNATSGWMPYAILGMFALMLIVVLIAIARG